MTQSERQGLLAALSETILPSDDGPGAAEARVGEYLERALDRLPARERAKIESGLELVASMAGQHYGKPFESCADEERSEVLKQLQRVPHPIARNFLSTAINLVIEGFLCDPSHGGNYAGLGWLAIGYTPGSPR
jgi:gluconate 2-dehydrogenase gamma chain